jgi:hypothetical protein
MVKRTVFFGACIFALLYGILVIINAVAVSKKPSDEEQIRNAIEEIRKASLDGREGGVLEYISGSFQLPEGIGSPESPFNRARDQVERFMRNATVETLTMNVKDIKIEDTLAIADVPSSGNLSYPPFFTNFEFNFPDMQIEFRKEMRKRLLIVPDPTWAVVRVNGISAENSL